MEKKEITFYGIFHTHFFGVNTLSIGDKNYIESIMKSMPISIEKLFFPIVVMPQKEIAGYEAQKEVERLIIKKCNITSEE